MDPLVYHWGEKSNNIFTNFKGLKWFLLRVPDAYAEQAWTTTLTISHEQAYKYSGVYENLLSISPEADFIYLFYFICHTIITKNIGKEEKKCGEEI